MIETVRAYFGFSRVPFGRELAPSMLHRHGPQQEAIVRVAFTIADRGLA